MHRIAARPAAKRGHAPPAERSEALDLERVRFSKAGIDPGVSQVSRASLARARSPKRRRYVPEVMVEGGRSHLGGGGCTAVQLDHLAQVGCEFVVGPVSAATRGDG